MSKAILEFDLNDPDDRRDFLRAVHASTLFSILFELRHNFMRKLEYELESGKDPYEAVKELLFDELTPINELTDELF